MQSVLYELPLGAGKRYLDHGLAANLLGRWQVSADRDRDVRLAAPLIASSMSFLAKYWLSKCTACKLLGVERLS